MCPIALITPAVAFGQVPGTQLGTLNAWTAAIFVSTLSLPAFAVLSIGFTIDAWRNGAGRWLRLYASVVSLSVLVLAGYLAVWGIVGFRPWTY